MKRFFDTKTTPYLGQILNEWYGTPYRHWSGVKQGGVDCIHFIVKVLEEVGYVDPGIIKIPWYDRDWHLHNTNELLFDGVLSNLTVLEIPVEKISDGDLFLFQFGKTMSHAGFFFDRKIWHAVAGKGVRRNPWYDRMWYKRIKKILRFYK